MKTRTLPLSVFLTISLFSFSCRTNLLVLEDMLPSARQQDFNVSFSQTSLADFALDLTLTYEISNPYQKDLPIPDHAMGIFVNDENLGLAAEHRSVFIPAKSSKVMTYGFKLTSGMLQSLLGKNNKITFHTSIELDLTEFSDMLPNYQLSVTENFDIETSEFKPLINNLLQKRIGKYNFQLEHSTHVKIPAPPEISVSSQPIEITLLGSGIDLINPNEIKNALIPFGDLLVNGELDGLKDPFIDAVINSTVTVPAPTVTEWFRTEEVNLEGLVLDLLNPLDPDIETKWGGTKTLLYRPAHFTATEYFVDNFLDPYIDNQASEKWDTFQEAYNDLKTTVLPDELPGPQTRGFEIAIPFAFRNTNEFPIDVPIFRSSVFVTNHQPFSIYVKPKNVNQVPLDQVPANIASIPANTTKTLYVVFSFDMQAFNQGMYSLFMRNEFEPTLKGIMSYDFGYGPLYVGYDLSDMGLNYK